MILGFMGIEILDSPCLVGMDSGSGVGMTGAFRDSGSSAEMTGSLVFWLGVRYDGDLLDSG